MSGDLISKKAVMSHIESEYRQWGEDYDAERILAGIEDFPAAYDTQKVINAIDNTVPDITNIQLMMICDIIMSGGVADD